MDMQIRGISPDPTDASPALATVRRLNDGFKAFQVLRAGFRSGLFDWLARNGPAEKSALSAALDLRGAHLGGFLQALEDLGLLAREGAAYRLAPGMEAVLCSGGAQCQAEVVEALNDPAGGWGGLDRFMAAGWAHQPSPVSLLAVHPFHDEADRLAAHLAQRNAGRTVAHILCFDGGDGLLAVALGRNFPQAQVQVVVSPEVAGRVQARIDVSSLTARCRVAAGTPLEIPAGEAVDLAVLFHALYSVRRTTNDALAAVAARLAPGGELHCAHWFCLEACETAPGGLRDLDKAVLTDSHPMCHVETFCDRFAKIDLVDAGRQDLVGEFGTTKLHYARRPA